MYLPPRIGGCHPTSEVCNQFISDKIKSNIFQSDVIRYNLFIGFFLFSSLMQIANTYFTVSHHFINAFLFLVFYFDFVLIVRTG